MLAMAAAQAAAATCNNNNNNNNNCQAGVSLSTVKTDTSALMDWRTKKGNNNNSFRDERKTLRPQLSKIAITSLEFSEALPFAAFASLLVEMVARLDNVIEHVEELGRIACFKEFDPRDDKNVSVHVDGDCKIKKSLKPLDVTRNNDLGSHGGD